LRLLDPHFEGADEFLKLHRLLLTHEFPQEDDSEFVPSASEVDTDDCDEDWT